MFLSFSKKKSLCCFFALNLILTLEEYDRPKVTKWVKINNTTSPAFIVWHMGILVTFVFSGFVISPETETESINF